MVRTVYISFLIQSTVYFWHINPCRYMCQINTDPMRSKKGYLQVVGMFGFHFWQEIKITIPNFADEIFIKRLNIVFKSINKYRLQSKIIHQPFFFSFSVPPLIVESSTSNDMVVREGSNVTLICKARGYPEPYVISHLNELFTKLLPFN